MLHYFHYYCISSNSFVIIGTLSPVFSENNVDLTKPLVTTCYLGHTATLLNMAAGLCGHHHTSLYHVIYISISLQLFTSFFVLET